MGTELALVDIKQIVKDLNACKNNQTKLEQFLDFIHETCVDLEQRRMDYVDNRIGKLIHLNATKLTFSEQLHRMGVDLEQVGDASATAAGGKPTADQLGLLDHTIDILHEIERKAIARLDQLTVLI